jgi:alkylation response protein AidB-like acyl-CoA dehydrogenase
MPGVDFELSEDQLSVRSAARELLGSRASPERVRAVVDAGGGWDRDLWADLVEQGWPALLAPEDLGGLELGWVEAAVLIEEVGAHVAPAPVLPQLVAVDTLAAAGEETWLGKLVAGDAVAAVAGRAVDAVASADGWELAGMTEPVAFAPSADVLLVIGTDRRLFLVELGDDRPEAEAAMDLTREMARVRLDGRTAVELGGADAVEAYLDRGAVALSAELLGIASTALDMAVRYAGEREQFGRPIGSFQAVKHRCADMLVDVEGMRSATWWAAWCLASGDPERSVAASTAKAWCSDAAERVLGSALQVHGGIGFTWECDLHLYLKRAQYDRVSFGSASAHRDRLAALLRGRLERGEPLI